MEEIGRLLQALGAVPQALAFGLLTVLALRTPAGLVIAKKLFNGQYANGSPKASNLAGEATVDFWSNRTREVMEDVMERHSREEERSFDRLNAAVEGLAQLQRDSIRTQQESAQRVVDAINGLKVDLAAVVRKRTT